MYIDRNFSVTVVSIKHFYILLKEDSVRLYIIKYLYIRRFTCITGHPNKMSFLIKLFISSRFFSLCQFFGKAIKQIWDHTHHMGSFIFIIIWLKHTCSGEYLIVELGKATFHMKKVFVVFRICFIFHWSKIIY